MEHKQEIRQIALTLQDIKDKAPKEYEEIKKVILDKYTDIHYRDTILTILGELED